MPENELEEKKPTPWTIRILKISLHSLWILAVSLVALEIILHIFDPIGLVFYADSGEYFRSKILHTGLGFYINRPGESYKWGSGISVSINREGFRDDDFSVEKSDKMIRVLSVGDSMTFGWGAPQESIFSTVLEKMALEEGFHCEVVNAAACSWNTRMELDFLKQRGELYKPDILLLLVVGNDLLTPENATPRRAEFFRNMVKGKTGLRHSYLVRTFFHFRNKFLAGPEFIETYERDSTVFDENVLALGEIISLCKSQNIYPLVFLGITGDGSSAFDQMYLGLYANELKKHGIDPEICQVYFSDSALKVSPTDPHPSALGHERIAQTMYPELRSLLMEISETNNES